MKRNATLLLIAFGLMSFLYTGDFYEQTITTIDNQRVDFQQFKGKRVMIIILPVSRDDSMNVTPVQIAALATQQKDSLVIIGVPGEETGYSDAMKEQVKSLYANEPSNFILASGMKVSKNSGESQSPLFQWLTDANKNKFFDKDVTETGQKFFVNKYGHLYAVVGAQVKLRNPIINKMLAERGH